MVGGLGQGLSEGSVGNAMVVVINLQVGREVES